MNFKLVSKSTSMNIPLSDFWIGNSECDVFSLLGQKIKTVNNRNELKDLPAGVYLLRNTQTQKVKKVVISE
jgi:hypothetical protein